MSDEVRRQAFDRLLDAAIANGRIPLGGRASYTSMWAEHPAQRDVLEKIVREFGHDELPAKSTQLDIAYDDVVADSQLLDYVVRAICLERDCDYVSALEQLSAWREDHTGKETTLKAIIEESSPVSFQKLRRDVMELERSTVGSEQAITLSADVPPRPSGETNEHGQVKLAGHVDRARLLTDPYELEKAFLAVRDLNPARYADREAFEREYRSYVEADLDLVATLQLQQHKAEVQRRQGRREVVQQQREHVERERRAERRKAAEAIRKNLEKL